MALSLSDLKDALGFNIPKYQALSTFLSPQELSSVTTGMQSPANYMVGAGTPNQFFNLGAAAKNNGVTDPALALKNLMESTPDAYKPALLAKYGVSPTTWDNYWNSASKSYDAASSWADKWSPRGDGILPPDIWLTQKGGFSGDPSTLTDAQLGQALQGYNQYWQSKQTDVGGILGDIASYASMAFGQPELAAAIGAINGGLQNGPLGAVLGGLGGYSGASGVAEAGGIGNYISNGLGSVESFLSDPIGSIGSGISSAWKDITGTISGLGSGIQSTLGGGSTAGSAASSAASGALSATNGALSAAGSGIPLANAGNTFGDQLVADAIGSGSSLAAGVAPAVGSFVTDPIAKAADTAGSLLKAGSALMGGTAAAGLGSALLTNPVDTTALPAVGVGAGYNVDPAAAAANPEGGAAALTNAQYSYFKDRVQPIETSVLGDIQDPNLPAKTGQYALDNTANFVDQTRGMEERQLSRFGLPVTDRQETKIARNFDLNKGLSLTSAFDSAASGAKDAQLQGASDALNIGRGLSGTALTSANSAATTQSAVNQNAANVNAQKTSNTWSTALTGAGLGAALSGTTAFSGIFGSNSTLLGGAIGGGLGLLASFL